MFQLGFCFPFIILPGDTGLGPSSHSAVQFDTLALPDGLSTRLDDKLWSVCQAVRVHLLTKFRPLLQLGQKRDIHTLDGCVLKTLGLIFDFFVLIIELPSCPAPHVQQTLGHV